MDDKSYHAAVFPLTDPLVREDVRVQLVEVDEEASVWLSWSDVRVTGAPLRVALTVEQNKVNECVSPLVSLSGQGKALKASDGGTI